MRARIALVVLAATVLAGCGGITIGPKPGPDIPGGVAALAGTYQCDQVADVDGSEGCEGGTPLELSADGSWKWGGFYVGTFRLLDGQVVFSDPLAGDTEAERAVRGGPAAWGPADVEGKDLVFRKDGVVTTWVRLGSEPPAAAGAAGAYVCLSQGGDPCTNDKDLVLTPGGKWTYGGYEDAYHVDGGEVRFTGYDHAATWGPATLSPWRLTFEDQDDLVWARIDEAAGAAAAGVWACVFEGTAGQEDAPCTSWTDPLVLHADGRWTLDMYEGTWDVAGDPEEPLRDVKVRGLWGPAYFGFATWDGADVLEFRDEEGTVRTYHRNGAGTTGSTGPAAGGYLCTGVYDETSYVRACDQDATLTLEQGAWTYSYLSGSYDVAADRLDFHGSYDGPPQWGEAYWDEASGSLLFQEHDGMAVWTPAGGPGDGGATADTGPGAAEVEGLYLCTAAWQDGEPTGCWWTGDAGLDLSDGAWVLGGQNGTYRLDGDGRLVFEGGRTTGPAHWGDAWASAETITFRSDSYVEEWTRGG